MTLTETELTESLDKRGLLAQARQAGTYALEVDTPDRVDTCATRWRAVHDHMPPEPTFEQLATAERVAYVGASSGVYSRLCDHIAGDVRKASFLSVFSPERVVGVWPEANPFELERRRARKVAEMGFTVWTDGVIIG